MLALLMLVPTGAIAAQEESPDLEFRFTYPEPTLSWEGGVLTVDIEGYGQHGQPGLPILPLAREQIPIQAGASILRVELVQTSVDLGSADGLAIASGYVSDDSSPSVKVDALDVLAGVVDGYALFDLMPVEVIDGRLVWHPSIEVRLWIEIDTALSSTLEGEGLDMLIVTNRTLAPAFQALADWKSNRSSTCPWLQDISVEVVAVEDIMLNASGVDTATEVRDHIIQVYQASGIDYVILGGDSECIPPRYIHISGGPLSEDVPSDMYYACLDGNWDADGDGRFGEDKDDDASVEEMDLTAEVAVGRVPADTPAEVADYVAKLIAYESTGNEAWLNDTLMLGTNLNTDGDGTWGKEYKEEVMGTFPDDPVLSVNTLYEKDAWYSEDDLMAALSQGPNLVNHMGHGSHRSISFHGWYLTPGDLDVMDVPHPYMMFSQACFIGAFDENPDSGGDCLGEEMALHPEGPVSLICNTREGWYQPGGTNGPTQAYDLAFFEHVMEGGIGVGDCLSLAREDLADMILQDDYYRWSAVSLNLLGDPEMAVRFNSGVEYDVAIESLDVPEAFWGRNTTVEATVVNMGNDTMIGNITLFADGAHVAMMELVLASRSSVSVPLEWVPSKMGLVELSCVIAFGGDGDASNDALVIQVECDLLVDGPMALEDIDIVAWADVLVTEDGVLWMNHSAIILGMGHGMQCWGEVSMHDTTLVADVTMLQGSSMQASESGLIGNVSSNLATMSLQGCELTDTILDLMATDLSMNGINATNMSAGIDNSTINVQGCTLVGGSWIINSSSGSITNSTWDSSEGIVLTNCSFLFMNGITVMNGSLGMDVGSCFDMVLGDMMLKGNEADLIIRGTEEAHWRHQVSNVTLTNGPLAYMVDGNGSTVSNASMVVLVSCTDVNVQGCEFIGCPVALTMIGCHGIIVTACLFQGNDLAIDAGGSEATIFGCDILENVLVVDAANECSFDAGYPTGGNYWGIAGIDQFSGPDQDQSGADGIFDMPYDVDGIIDAYPSVQSFTVPNHGPEASFTVSAEAVDTAEAVMFTDTSTDDGSIVGRWWDLGDGNTSEAEAPSHGYADDGSYTVILTVTDNRGSTDSAQMQVTVRNRAPEASIGCSDRITESGIEVNFDDLSTDPDGVIVSRSWDFGDGQTSNESSTTHAFSIGGKYTVTLVVLDDDGATSSVTIIMLVDRVAPTAAFTYQQGDGLSVSFTDSSSDEDGIIESWSWAFGDGTFSNESDPIHSYPMPGEYMARLQVTDDDGMTDEEMVTLIVNNSAPVAAFDISTMDPLTLEEVELVDRSTDDMGIVDREWDFGDGNVSCGNEVTHTYDDDGVFTVRLTVTDDQGESSSCSMAITVHNRAPTCSPSMNGLAMTMVDIMFTPGDGDLDGAVVAWLWDFGDLATATDASPTHHYHVPGQYTVTLTIWDDDDASVNGTICMDICPQPPTCDLSWSVPDAKQADQILLSCDANDPDGEVESVIWALDDVAIANGSSALVRLTSGLQTVNCTVIDSQGLSATESMAILVSLPNLLIEGPMIIIIDGGWARASIEVRCTGSWDIDGVGVFLLLDEVMVRSIVLGMESGSCASVEFLFQITPGTHTVIAEVDGGDLVTEVDEGDNIVVKTIDVEGDIERGIIEVGPLLIVMPVMLLAVVALYILVRGRE